MEAQSRKEDKRDLRTGRRRTPSGDMLLQHGRSKELLLSDNAASNTRHIIRCIDAY